MIQNNQRSTEVSSSESSNQDENTTIFKESSTNLGLRDSINQVPCLDACFSMNFSFPRVHLLPQNENLTVRTHIFEGIFHFTATFILSFLFGRSSVETFEKRAKKAKFLDFSETSNLETWLDIDNYFIKVNKLINLKKQLKTFEQCELFLHRVSRYIITPLLQIIKKNEFGHSYLGLCAITLNYKGNSEYSQAGFPDPALISKKKLRNISGTRAYIRHVRSSTDKKISVKSIFEEVIKNHDTCPPLENVFRRDLNQLTFFRSTTNSPDNENLKKLSIPTALIHIHNLISSFDVEKESKIAMSKLCLDLFKSYTFACYKLKVFECAIARGGDIDANIEAIELASNISFN